MRLGIAVLTAFVAFGCSKSTTDNAKSGSVAPAATSGGATTTSSETKTTTSTGAATTASTNAPLVVAGTIAIDPSIGETLANRRVDLQDANADVVASTYADSSGNYSFPPGVITIAPPSLTDGPNYTIVSLIDSDKAGKVFGVKQAVDLSGAVKNGVLNVGTSTFAEISAIKGQLQFVDAAGKVDLDVPVDGTEVYIPGQSFFAKTDGTGKFLLLYLPAASYSLRLQQGSFSKTMDVTVATGKTTNVGLVSIVADTIAPVTTASLTSTDFKNPTCVTLTSNKAGKTYFTTDGSTPLATNAFLYDGTAGGACGATSQCAICVQGHSTTLKYFSVDVAGNVENQRSEFYFYNVQWADPNDKSPPVTTATINGQPVSSGAVFTSQVSVTLTASEGGTTLYSTDPNALPNAFATYTAPITIAATTLLRFYSIDFAGNAEAVRAITLNVYRWRELTSDGPTPPSVSNLSLKARYSSMAYDQSRKTMVMVIYDPNNGPGTLAAYEWAPGATAWNGPSAITPAGFRGGSDYSFPMVYNSVRGKIYLLLPINGAMNTFDYYEYEYTPGSPPTLQQGGAHSNIGWQTTTASGFGGAAAIYDGTDNEMVILTGGGFGGGGGAAVGRVSFGNALNADQWNLSSEETGLVDGMYHFAYGSAVYADASQSLLFFGDGTEGQGTTLLLSRNAFGDSVPAFVPKTTSSVPPVFCPDVVYMKNLGVPLLFGGTDNLDNSGNPLPPHNDSWIFDGTDWAQQALGTKPPPRFCASMVYNPDTKAVVLYGGLDHFGNALNDTWEFSY